MPAYGAGIMLHFLSAFVLLWMSFGAARRFTPDPTGRRDLRRHWIGILFWSTIGATLSAGPPPLWAAVAGTGGLLGSLVLFQWASHSTRGRMFSYIFSYDTPQFLHTAGPYAYVRNPFYASYLLAVTSVVVMWPTVPAIAIAVVATVYFEMAARFEERKFESSALRAEYNAYKARTGRLLPRLTQLAGQEGSG